MSPLYLQKRLLALLLLVAVAMGFAAHRSAEVARAVCEIDTGRHTRIAVSPKVSDITVISVAGENLDEALEGLEEVSVPAYEALSNGSPYENDFELLAHLINAEAGAPWVEDEVLYGVGSVVLNRMKSDEFPETMEDVVYQSGQYAVIENGHIDDDPSERSYAIAADLMENGATLPDSVVFQANFRQGAGVYQEIQGMYFCYKGGPETLESVENDMFISGEYEGYEEYLLNKEGD